MFLTMVVGSDFDLLDLFYGTKIRRSHTDNFLVGFDRLIKLARNCDTDNIILDSLIYSAHGLLSTRMRKLHPDFRFEIITGTNSEAYLERIIREGSGSAN